MNKICILSLHQVFITYWKKPPLCLHCSSCLIETRNNGHLNLNTQGRLHQQPRKYPVKRLILSFHLLLGLPSGLFPKGFPTKTMYTPLLSPIRSTCPAQLILLDFITRTILGEEYRSLSSSLCSFLHSLVTLSFLGPNILLNAPFSDIRSLSTSLSVSDQVPRPCKTTAKIIVLYILIFKFLRIKCVQLLVARAS